MRYLLAPFLALNFGCGGADGDSTDPGSDRADSGSDTGDTNDTATCEAVSSGTDWAWNGDCPRMRTPCDIVVTECSFEIDYEADGGMDMDMPHSATVVGSTVTFGDDNSVTGCTGTVLNADSIEGTCDSGCEFTLSR